MNCFYSEGEDGVLRQAEPARIVCYDEGDGEWTIDAEDESCRCLRDKQGNYPASVWNNEENECEPIDEKQAVAKASEMRRVLSFGNIPIYVARPGEGCELAEA